MSTIVGQKTHAHSIHRIRESSLHKRAAEAAATNGQSGPHALLWNPPEPQKEAWAERVSPATRYRKEGRQHRKREQAPTPPGPKVTVRRMPADRSTPKRGAARQNNPLTTHAPSRAPDRTTLNEPHPAMPVARKQMATSSGSRLASLGTNNRRLPPRPPRPDSTNETLFERISEGNRRALAGFTGAGSTHESAIRLARRWPRPHSTNEVPFEAYTSKGNRRVPRWLRQRPRTRFRAPPTGIHELANPWLATPTAPPPGLHQRDDTLRENIGRQQKSTRWLHRAPLGQVAPTNQ